MTKKQLLLIVTFIILAIIIFVLTILMIKFRNLYVNLRKEPAFGYYLDRDLQMTSIDEVNHNMVYLTFFEGEHDGQYVKKLLNFLYYYNRYNSDNKYLYVKVYYKNEEYNVDYDESIEKLLKLINGSKRYKIMVGYGEDSGFITSITIDDI